MSLQFDKTIKAGDVLTSLTVLLSVVALVLSLAKDRAGRTAEQANRVRSAAASAIIKLDRWQSVQLSLYQELQPTFVEISEGLAQKYDVVVARDKFWRQVNQERTRLARQVLEEQLGTAYLEILAYFPLARAKYIEAFNRLATIEDDVTNNFLGGCEQAILGFKGKETGYQTAQLGNALRAQASSSATELRRQSEAIVAPVRNYLLSVIVLPDEEIVNSSRSTPDG